MKLFIPILILTKLALSSSCFLVISSNKFVYLLPRSMKGYHFQISCLFTNSAFKQCESIIVVMSNCIGLRNFDRLKSSTQWSVALWWGVTNNRVRFMHVHISRAHDRYIWSRRYDYVTGYWQEDIYIITAVQHAQVSLPLPANSQLYR